MDIYRVSIYDAREDAGQSEWLVRASSEAQALALVKELPEFQDCTERAKLSHWPKSEVPSVSKVLGRRDTIAKL